jgi:hypothetical protein
MKLSLLNWKSTSSNIYRKCDEMPLWNFQKYLETNELKYFTKELKEVKGLDIVMNDFFIEYLELTKNNSVFRKFSNIYKLMKLEGKYKCIVLLTNSLYNYDIKYGIDTFNNLVAELDKWGYKIDVKGDIFEQLETINQRNRVLETQINTLQIELKKDDKEESQSIEAQLISVSRILELNYKLNAKDITVMEWVELQKQAELTIKNQKKNGK